MEGTLYICGTPIGNLEDISLRCLRILKEVDVIAAEDTRHTIKLLNYYEIETPLTSYHKFNEKQKTDSIIKQLQSGKNVALVTDAGMPCISDPGENLIKTCYEYNISVTTVPGPTALTTALAISAMDTRRFIFEGFLPVNRKDRKEIINPLIYEKRTTVFYEAPHHLLKTLKELYELLGNREIVLVRELTKKFEEIKHMNLSESIDYYSETPPKGEYVIILNPPLETEFQKLKDAEFENISMEDHVKQYEEKGLNRKDSMKAVAKERGVSKSIIYKELNYKKNM